MEINNKNNIIINNKDNNIMESNTALKGLYILSAPLLDEKNVVKLGMSGCLQNRIKSYTSYLKNPYYMACYKLNDALTKKEITAIETLILNITIQYKAENFTSEYRKISFEQLHDIVCDFLNKNGLTYTIFINPIWKYFNKNKKIKVIIIEEPEGIKGPNTIEEPEAIKKSKTIEAQEAIKGPNTIEEPGAISKPKAGKKTKIVKKTKVITKPKMVKHKCPTCKRDFQRKGNLEDHLNKKNKCKQEIIIPPNFEQIQVNNLNVIIPTKNDIVMLPIIDTTDKHCRYCNKSFARKDIAIRHMNKFCSIAKQQNKEKQEIVDKLKIENKEQQEIIDKLKSENKLLEKIKQLEDGTKQLQNEIKNLKKEQTL